MVNEDGFTNLVFNGSKSQDGEKPLSSDAVLGEGWRDARKELPEERGYYLCYLSNCNGEKVFRVNFLICKHDGFGRNKKFDGPVIAWRPLPDPPAFD